MTPKSYDDIKTFIGDALARRQTLDVASIHRPSRFWEHFASQFRYVRGLDDEELRHVRRHTYHLTGDSYIQYALPSRSFPAQLAAEYRQLTERLGGFQADEGDFGVGIDVDDHKVSRDLLRYQEVVGDLAESGCLDRQTPARVLEIGGGYGGLAACIHQFNSRVTYVITDLEETMFFQAVNLTNRFGWSSVELCADKLPPDESMRPGCFYLLPQTSSSALAGHRFDLAVNQQSMQEMEERQVRHYCDLIARTSSQFYSCNLDQHPDAIAERMKLATGLRAIFSEVFAGTTWRAGTQSRWDRLANRVLRKSNRRRFTDESLPRVVYRCPASLSQRAA